MTPVDPLLEEALLIARRSPDAPEQDLLIGSALNNLANATGAAGDYEGARDLLVEALAIFTAALPANHPNLGALNGNLSLFERNLGKLSSARDYAERSVAIARDSLPSGHPVIADDLHQFSSALLYLGDFGGAAVGFAEGAEIYQQKFGDKSYRIASPLLGLAFANLSAGDLEKAAEAYQSELKNVA